MKIALVRNRTIGSLLIRLVTWSRWHHGGVVTKDGKFVIESVFKHGVVKTPIAEFKARYSTVDFFNINCDDKKAFEFLNAQIGKSYDYFAASSLLFKLLPNHKDKWYCFELIAAASGLFRKERNSRVTADILWMISHD